MMDQQLEEALARMQEATEAYARVEEELADHYADQAEREDGDPSPASELIAKSLFRKAQATKAKMHTKRKIVDVWVLAVETSGRAALQDDETEECESPGLTL